MMFYRFERIFLTCRIYFYLTYYQIKIQSKWKREATVESQAEISLRSFGAILT